MGLTKKNAGLNACTMAVNSSFLNNKMTRAEIESRLRALQNEFDREMRARGFDPAQAENVALPSALAKLWSKLEELRAQIDEPDNLNERD